MITEAMVIKGFAYVGAWTIGTRVIAPVAQMTGKALGHGVAKLVNSIDRKGGKRTQTKGKVEDDQVTEQQLLALLKECNEHFSEDETKEEPDNAVAIVEEVKPEPMFDQRMRNWIQKCKDQYGGFANVVLE